MGQLVPLQPGSGDTGTTTATDGTDSEGGAVDSIVDVKEGAGVRGGGDEGGKTPGKKKRRLGGGVAIRDAVGSPTGMLH
jgi:hypothetical protein